jgi:hypothetical protein
MIEKLILTIVAIILALSAFVVGYVCPTPHTSYSETTATTRWRVAISVL